MARDAPTPAMQTVPTSPVSSTSSPSPRRHSNLDEALAETSLPSSIPSSSYSPSSCLKVKSLFSSHKGRALRIAVPANAPAAGVDAARSAACAPFKEADFRRYKRTFSRAMLKGPAARSPAMTRAPLACRQMARRPWSGRFRNDKSASEKVHVRSVKE